MRGIIAALWGTPIGCQSVASPQLDFCSVNKVALYEGITLVQEVPRSSALAAGTGAFGERYRSSTG